MVKSASKGRAQPAAQASEAPLPASYEAALTELDALVARMEGGNLSLEDSLVAYRRGAALVRFCQQQLGEVEQQVRMLDGETLTDTDTDTDSSASREDDDL